MDEMMEEKQNKQNKYPRGTYVYPDSEYEK